MKESLTDADSLQSTTKHSGTNLFDAELSHNPEDFYIKTAGITFSMPKKSAWTVQLLGNVFFNPDEGKEPNWFHRKMQEFCFGFKWSKKK